MVRLRYSVMCATPASTAAWSCAHEATKHVPPRFAETHVKEEGAVAVSEAATSPRPRPRPRHRDASGKARMAVVSPVRAARVWRLTRRL